MSAETLKRHLAILYNLPPIAYLFHLLQARQAFQAHPYKQGKPSHDPAGPLLGGPGCQSQTQRHLLAYWLMSNHSIFLCTMIYKLTKGALIRKCLQVSLMKVWEVPPTPSQMICQTKTVISF